MKEDWVRLEVVVTVVMVVDVVVVKSGVAHSFKMRPSISVRWSVRPFVRSHVSPIVRWQSAQKFLKRRK